MEHRRGDVVVTLFPFADGTFAKERPALIVIGPWRAAKSVEVCWAAMITTTILKGWPGDIDVPDLASAGLPISSIVRTLKLACIDMRNITRKVGTLDSDTLRAVRKSISARVS
ncbi:MAG TPA: type II toxin-antitoxin system PemK/MazF family toxin [Candidatus Paceibacterota bacterium]